MRRFAIMLVLITFFAVSINTAYASCAPDPDNPSLPCDDTRGTLILNLKQAEIENIDGQLFRVIGPFTLQAESNDTIRLDNVKFSYPSYPVPHVPGGVMSVNITFQDGTNEKIGRVGPPTSFVEFTDHYDPKAGVRRNSDGTFNFLLSVEKQSIPPFKQLEKGILPNEIECKDGFVQIFKKSDNTPACVTLQTKTKLEQRGWAHSTGDIVKQRSGNTETKTELSDEPTVHPLPFGMTQKKIELQLHVEPIYTKNPSNPDELILDLDAMMQVQKILYKCDYRQKLESGEIPARNPDGSVNVITSSLRFYNNGTHYIDSSICKWIDSFEAVTYNCFEAKPTEQNWYDGPSYFDNGTHRIDVQTCEWLKNKN